MKTHNHFQGHNFPHIFQQIAASFLSSAVSVHPRNWQGMDVSQRREMTTYELMNVTFTQSLTALIDAVPLEGLSKVLESNWPWCEDHFQERVCGAPINPGTEWANWPWGDHAEKFLDESGQFNHNYMERYWPKQAGVLSFGTAYVEDWDSREADSILDMGCHQGIRNDYGDLNDLIQQLVDDPLTRQTWFPVFHPEDVGEVVGGRKPCTLGYQFIVRSGQLHVWYPLRSCDFIRHFRDDIYLTIRLAMWVLEQCQQLDPDNWANIKLGSYSMHCTSLHVFTNDYIQMGGQP